MPRRKHIEPRGAEHYVLSDVNPNAHLGGGCLCHASNHSDQVGPFVVFTGSQRAAAVGGREPYLVACTGCMKKAVLDAEDPETEVGHVGVGARADAEFDGGDPDMPVTAVQLKAQYESKFAGTPIIEIPTFDEWLVTNGYDDLVYSARGGLDVTGIDPSATSLVQARADTTKVGVRGGAVHGRTDDPVEQLGNPDNWGVPEHMTAEDTAPPPPFLPEDGVVPDGDDFTADSD